MTDAWQYVYLARGRSNATTTTAVVSAGGRVLPLTAVGTMAEGDVIFISEADDSEVEVLGLIESIDTLDVTTTFPVTAAKLSGATVWVATLAAYLPHPPGQAPSFGFDSGVTQVVPLDGVAQPTRVRDSSETLTLEISGGEASWLADVRTFLTSASGADDGMNAFALAAWDYETGAMLVATALLMGGIPSWISRRGGIAGSDALTVQLQSRGVYPA